MKYLLLFLFAWGYCMDDNSLVVTRAYVDYLKKHVNWGVEDYENNVFRGWTIGEIKQFLGLIDLNTTVEGASDVQLGKSLPSAVNWAGSKCDHAVKNQGSCGACWAFVAANMLSDRCCLELSSDKGWLSIQELISCDNASFGCYGGSLGAPVRYMKANKGLVPEECYPYIGKKEECPTKCEDGKDWKESHVCNCAKIVNCYLTQGIKSCLNSGPVPIGFSVCPSFISYKNGTYSCDCDSYIGNHATLAMGYSDKPECHYYLKNSWGTRWGTNGYYNMSCDTCNLAGGSICSEISD
jgi:C1A family cysteine protease